MPRYSATVRVFDLDGADKASAQRDLEQRLQNGKLGRWAVVQLTADPPPLPVRQPSVVGHTTSPQAVGPILLLGALGWAFWFYWLILG